LKTDVLIIGAGAAGLMCAIAAGQRGRRVLVVDHANKVGKKILMSGGGRCNFTNTGATPANYLSANPHFAKSALARYTPADFISLVEKHRIAYHEKELGQLFCDDSSKQIVRMLLDECAAAGVTVEASCGVQRVRKTPEGFSVFTARGEVHAESLVIACGGLSIPSMGASGFGYELARQFGHAVLPTRAGLVPLTLSGKHQEHYQDLAGVALPVVEARVGKQAGARRLGASVWEIPAGEPTAQKGRWLPGPGEPLFRAIADALGPLPIIAEDLGVITPDVDALRKAFDFPGMRILQFAWGDDVTAERRFLPHRHEPDSVVYTGTHDNDTSLGWWASAAEATRHHLCEYLASDGRAVHWDLIRAACASVADSAIYPLQDVMGLDGSHRMNFPGQPAGRWVWRFDWAQVPADAAARLRRLGQLYDRC